jgi:hypothetical protein
MTVSEEILHLAIANGRVDIVKALLERGYDPGGFVKLDRDCQFVVEVSFRQKSSIRGQLANTIEDYEECKRLVREASANKPRVKSTGRTSKRKEKNSRSRRPW